MRFKFLINTVSSSVLFLFVFTGWTAAAEPNANQELINLVKGLQDQMALLKGTIEKQDAKIRQLETRGPQVQMAQPSQTQGEVTPVPPMSDYEFNQRLDAATGGAQKWLKDLKFSGDFRLRYEAFANHGTFSDPDRNRFRFRLRYGFEKGFGDQMKVGFSLASGEKVTNNGHNGDPTSTNQTMGNLEDFKNIWIEKAYATYKPNWAQIGPISALELTGGKFTNPFEKGSSDLIFDRDLKPEGAYETVKMKLLDTDDFDLESYFTAGQFILQEGSTVGTDAELYGFQLGISPTVYVPWMDRPLNFFGAVSYYDYSDFEKSRSWRIDQNATGQSLANGNSVCSATNLCTSYKVADYYGEVTLTPYAGIPITPFIDVAQNFDEKQSSFDRHAWTVGTKLGKQLKKGDWQFLYQYKWLGADATPGAFTDSDFGYRGYNGNKGNIFKLGYLLTDNLSLNAAAFYVRNLNIGGMLDATAPTTLLKSEEQQRYQLDLVWKF